MCFGHRGHHSLAPPRLNVLKVPALVYIVEQNQLIHLTYDCIVGALFNTVEKVENMVL